MNPSRHMSRWLLARAVGAVSVSLPWPLLLFLVWDSTHNVGVVGLTAAARMVPLVSGSGAAGALPGGRRGSLLLRSALVCRVLALAGCAAALAAGSVLGAVAAAVVAAAASHPVHHGLVQTAGVAEAPDGGDPDRELMRHEVLAFLVAVLLGGLLLVVSPRDWVMLLSLAGVIGSGIGLWGVRLPETGGTAVTPPTAERADNTLAELWRTSSEWQRALPLVAVLSGVLSAAGVSLLPLTTRLGAEGQSSYGLALAALAGGALASRLLVPRVEVSVPVPVGLAGCAVALVLLGVCGPTAWVAGPAMLLGAAVTSVLWQARELVVGQRTDRQGAGVGDMVNSLILTAALVGALLAPALLVSFGATATLVVLGLGVAGMIGFAGLPDDRWQRTPSRTPG